MSLKIHYKFVQILNDAFDELCHCCQLHRVLGIHFMLPVNVKSVFTAILWNMLFLIQPK